jgi:polyisoprenoid-binding protein YceI
MKKQILIAGRMALLLCLSLCVQAADTATYISKPGSKMRMEGTSNIHDWQVESPFIGGFIEAGPNFPVEPGQAATAGKVDGKVDVFITVRSLKSVEKDGKPYSDKMDEVMWDKLKVMQFPKIQYHLNELVLKEAAKSKDAPYLLEATGDLVVAGATNKITMPVSVTPLGDKKLKVSGSTSLKMTSFGIQPPAPAIALGVIKTGDEVKLIFNWMVAQKPAAK